MLIPYKIFGDGERLPFITLTLKGPRTKSITEAFVDSGADFSIFHAGWIDHLGLPPKKGIIKRIQVGDGDYIRAFLFEVDVIFYQWIFKAPLTFSENLGPGFNLLGRKSFFNRFKFCFDDKHYCLSITPL